MHQGAVEGVRKGVKWERLAGEGVLF